MGGFGQVAHRLFYGDRPDPETGVDPVLALLDGTRELLAEVDHRNRTLRNLPASVCPEGKLTEELSRTASAGMPLILMVIDEVQRAFSHKEYGEELNEVLTDLAKVGPSAGIMLLAATQKSDSKSTPTGFRDQFGLKFALRVTTMHSSEAILGAGAYGEGLDASKLPPEGKGCGLLRGTGDRGASRAAGPCAPTSPTAQTPRRSAAAAGRYGRPPAPGPGWPPGRCPPHPHSVRTLASPSRQSVQGSLMKLDRLLGGN
ncbi:MAG TPA: hypothetical protein VFQ77_19270 [Pseudonocardiaceae bacterium]|nr:hypothetical protein [Pseudonocardiaceae bacterium]